MAAIFGHAWTSNYGANPEGVAADTWAAVLSGLKPGQIAQGLQRLTMQGGEWPPSAPAFRGLCIGIPSMAEFRLTFGSSDDDRPFNRLAWQCVDGWKWRNADGKAQERMLREAYQIAKQLAMEDGQLPEPVEQRLEQSDPDPVPEKSLEEQARIHAEAIQARADLRKKLGMEDEA